MNLTLLFDYRFFADKDKVVFSSQNYNYSLFAHRYLTVFDQVTVLARVIEQDSPERQGRFTEGDGVRVISVGNWNGPISFVRQKQIVKAQLREFIEPNSAVIMIVPGILGTFSYTDFNKLGRPYGLEVVGDPYDVFAPKAMNHPFRPLFRWWFTRNLKLQCANAVATTYVTAKALQQRYPPNPLTFTTHCSDVELVCIENAPYIDPSQQTFTLINVGTMAQLYKAQDILIKALSICVKQGLAVHLVLVGDGKHRSDLEALVKKFGLSDHVEFLGQLPAGEGVRRQLDKADLFVMPSITEGLPRAMIEAMARGLPCIGTNVGGIPELMDEDSLVPVNDSNALAQKIREVLLDPERRKQMSLRNLEVAKQYRSDVMQSRRVAFYTYLKEKTAEWRQQQRR